MTRLQELRSHQNSVTRASRAIHLERLRQKVTSTEAAAKAYVGALLTFSDDPSPQNAGLYLAASKRLAELSEVRSDTTGESGHFRDADSLPDAA